MAINEVTYEYGTFSTGQLNYFKEKMRKKIFWLIVYTDKNTNQNYLDVDVEKYQDNLMGQIAGFNALLFYPNELVDVMTSLKAAMLELQKDSFNFTKYKKHVFDAGAMIDKLTVGDSHECP